MNKPHCFTLRVYIEDTDIGGIVYYANYLNFAERARTELLRDIGISHADMIRNQGVMFVVRSCLLNCLASARLDDVLEVKTYLKRLGRAKIELSQAIVREDQLVATLDVVLACINSSGKPVKIDDRYRHMLVTFGSDVER
jgi:acyl-CoA thioester hydrolase